MEKKGSARLAFLLAFAVSLVPFLPEPAFAEYKELMHDEWHRHGDNFSMDGKFYELKASATPTKVIVSINGNVIAVENGTCIDTMNMSVCLNNTRTPDPDIHEIFRPEDNEYRLMIWYYLAKLAIDKNIEKTEFMVGEKVKVEVTIMNDGSLPADGIYFRDVYFSASYPDFFVSNVVGCDYDRHNVTWEGKLWPTQTKTCTYYLEAIRSTTFEAQAKATYLVGILNRTRTAESPLIKITVPKVELDFNKSLNSTSVWVGDDVEFNFSIENNIEGHTFRNVALSIEVPAGLRITNISGGLSPVGKALRWTGEIEPGEIRNFTIMMKLIRSGNHSIKTNINYNIDHLVKIVDFLDNITSKIDSLEFRYNSFPERRHGKSAAILDVGITNPSKRYAFSDVKVNFSTNLPLNKTYSSFGLGTMGRGHFASILKENASIPEARDITTYTTRFGVEYITEYGEKIHKEESRQLTVYPKEERRTLLGNGAKNGVIEKLEDLNLGRYAIFIVIAFLLFILSIIHFIRKMTKKVREYEGL